MDLFFKFGDLLLVLLPNGGLDFFELDLFLVDLFF